uniref:Ycf19 n=1 Tax=Corynecladia elata TaxID=3101723 RepID=A0AA51NFQ1_9FLOR|nr:Ycf19 [Laurencia elata]WMP12789.1 Ycf19 [Laurencia elata]
MTIVTYSLNLVFTSVANFSEIYLILILLKLSLAWFPTVNWYNEPFCSLNRLTDPYLKLFRGTIPMIFGMDMSPMLGIIFLQCLTVIFNNIKIETIK